MSFFSKKAEDELVEEQVGKRIDMTLLRPGRTVFVVFAVIIGIALALSCLTVVATSEVAVVTTFGRVTGTAETGFHFKAPWQQYHRIDLSVQKDTGEYATATKDSQAVSQEVTIRWEVDPDSVTTLYERYLGNHKERLLDAIKGDAIKEGSATLGLTEYIPKREQLRTAMKGALDQQLAGQGIRVLDVSVANVVLPEGFEKAIADRQVAEEKKKTATINQETAQIDAETNRILAESYERPEFFKIEWLKKWDGKLPSTLVVGEDSGDTVIPLR
ncbi:MAG: prohibitin family protein [Coriobacteriia bacterium]|nr:prohibitin family protein [Coriobacteriia bacterium]